MSVPSGTFTNPVSGRLQVTFSGTWLTNSSDWGSGAWSLALRCVVDNGTIRQTAIIDILTSSAIIELDYTSNTNVSVSMAEISYNIVGAGTVAATKLRIGCCLIKR